MVLSQSLCKLVTLWLQLGSPLAGLSLDGHKERLADSFSDWLSVMLARNEDKNKE